MLKTKNIGKICCRVYLFVLKCCLSPSNHLSTRILNFQVDLFQSFQVTFTTAQTVKKKTNGERVQFNMPIFWGITKKVIWWLIKGKWVKFTPWFIRKNNHITLLWSQWVHCNGGIHDAKQRNLLIFYFLKMTLGIFLFNS